LNLKIKKLNKKIIKKIINNSINYYILRLYNPNKKPSGKLYKIETQLLKKLPLGKIGKKLTRKHDIKISLHKLYLSSELNKFLKNK